ncbi:hypothetical protein M8C21_027155, partial [Ambrosia artemisiifolia]
TGIALITEVVEKLPSPYDIKVLICTQLIKLVDRVGKIIPEIEATKPRCSSGIDALCNLVGGLENAKLLIKECCESSKLYLALNGNSILSRCKKEKNLLEQNSSKIQNMVPVMLASKACSVVLHLLHKTLMQRVYRMAVLPCVGTSVALWGVQPQSMLSSASAIYGS